MIFVAARYHAGGVCLMFRGVTMRPDYSKVRGKSGIYRIYVKDGFQAGLQGQSEYIGQSIDIARRWQQHYYGLLYHKHKSPPLQRAWDKYGSDAFGWEAIEFTEPSPSILAEREQYYFDLLRPRYNSSFIGGPSNRLGAKHTPETREKL